MTIDPRLYEKVTGRMPGDAQKAYGEALAKSARSKSKTRAQAERSFSDRYVSASFKWHWWASIIGSIVVIVAVILGIKKW